MPNDVREKLANDLECFGESYGEVKLQDTDKYVKQGVDKILSVIGEEIKFSEAGWLNFSGSKAVLTGASMVYSDLRARLEKV